MIILIILLEQVVVLLLLWGVAAVLVLLVEIDSLVSSVGAFRCNGATVGVVVVVVMTNNGIPVDILILRCIVVRVVSDRNHQYTNTDNDDNDDEYQE